MALRKSNVISNETEIQFDRSSDLVFQSNRVHRSDVSSSSPIELHKSNSWTLLSPAAEGLLEKTNECDKILSRLGVITEQLVSNFNEGVGPAVSPQVCADPKFISHLFQKNIHFR
jgi:hypothetical protein